MVEEKIKDYLKEQGISQVYLAGKAEIDLPKLNLSLNGKRRLSEKRRTRRKLQKIEWMLPGNGLNVMSLLISRK